MREGGDKLIKLWPVGGHAGDLLAENLLATGCLQLGGCTVSGPPSPSCESRWQSDDPVSFRRDWEAGLPSNLPIDGHSFRRVEVLTGTRCCRCWSAVDK